VGLAFWIFSSKAGAATYFTENGSQISETEYEALCVKKIEDIQELEHILNGDSPKNPGATKLLVAESSANESNQDDGDADAEEDEDVEEDEEYDDEVAQINDPLYGINYAFFKLNDILYGTVISNFFYNLRFPIRFVNSLLQFKGTKAVHELGGFLLNSTIGIAGLGEVASHWDLKPSPEDLGQTLGYWGAGNGFFIMYPILGPSSLRDSARFIDSLFLDPVSWLQYNKFGGYSWRTTLAITAYDKFNELSLSYEDIDALKAAALDPPYVGMRDAYVEHRNKLISE
jgi:phospholipid-binding lipoprotein MlaA